MLALLAVASFAAAPAAERVVVPSGEWRLVADLVRPAGDGPLPAALLLNKAGGDRGAYAGLAAALADRGIASLALDLRGHGDSVNRGRFVPGENLEILQGTERDVAAAWGWLAADPGIDANRIAVVGASYSGEQMMLAPLPHRAAAYVALSPGSLSDESIATIDREGLPFLLVVARHERWLTEVAQALREQSRSAEFLELSGSAHATELLEEHADLAERLAVWIDHRLQPAARR